MKRASKGRPPALIQRSFQMKKTTAETIKMMAKANQINQGRVIEQAIEALDRQLTIEALGDV